MLRKIVPTAKLIFSLVTLRSWFAAAYSLSFQAEHNMLSLAVETVAITNSTIRTTKSETSDDGTHLVNCAQEITKFFWNS